MQIIWTEMMKNILGREKEKELLTQMVQSNRAELMAVYGRKRIAKLF